MTAGPLVHPLQRTPELPALALPAAPAATTRFDDWPRTGRILPWLLAAFMAMLWLVPFDSVQFPGGGPVDLKLDRVMLILLGAVWVAALVAGGPARPRFRSSPLLTVSLVFIAASVISVVHNYQTLFTQDETGLALKKLILLLSFASVLWMVTTIVRPSEVPAFIRYMVGLSCVTALGIVIQYRTHYNVFFDVTTRVMPGPVTVFPPPGDNPGRPTIAGPTLHGIAVASMFAMALPFAVVGMARHHGWRRRAYGLAAGLLLAGGVSTFRKTGLVAPAAALAILTLYRPRMMVRLLPAGLVLAGVLAVVAHGALVGVKAQLVPQNLRSDSTESRTADYDATWPDVYHYAALGRGYGTYDPHKYRFLDNEYLHRLIEEGVIGLLAFAAVIATGIVISVRTVRRLGPVRGSPAMACVASLGAFAVSCAIYDALAYPQSGYMLFLIGGFAVCASADSRERIASRGRWRDVRHRRPDPR